jgi:RNA polymerase sigma-70 factor, ECF subfamily
MLPADAKSIIDSLFESWYAVMVRYSGRMLGRLDVAEEVTQDAFMQLYRELCDGRPIENPRAWTFCVLRRQAARQIQHHIRREVSLNSLDIFDMAAAPAAPESLDAYDVERMLGVLTPRELEVVLLRMEALKYCEIAAELGVSANTVNVLLARAVRKLQRFFQPVQGTKLRLARRGTHVTTTLQ